MIKTSALQFAYPGAAPLHFPDVDVPQGATLLLRGPSGSGKSTWLALAAALVPLRAGFLQVAGQDLAALSRVQADTWRARNLGFLPQTLHLSAALTVAQNLGLAFWAADVAHDGARIDAVLAEQAPMRERAQQYLDDPTLVRNIVADGCEKARKLARETMREVRDVMGLNYT
jgi:putative ABC transport system ATP-binding protein